jgi:hypothetical protein
MGTRVKYRYLIELRPLGVRRTTIASEFDVTACCRLERIRLRKVAPRPSSRPTSSLQSLWIQPPAHARMVWSREVITHASSFDANNARSCFGAKHGMPGCLFFFFFCFKPAYFPSKYTATIARAEKSRRSGCVSSLFTFPVLLILLLVRGVLVAYSTSPSGI